MLCGPDNVFDLPWSPVLRGSQPTQSDLTPHNSLVDIIEENAQGPRSARGDVGEVQQHSLPDQIEADRYLAAQEAGSKPHKALRFAKFSPPGAA